MLKIEREFITFKRPKETYQGMVGQLWDEYYPYIAIWLEEKAKKAKEAKKPQKKKKFSLRGWGNVKKVFKLEGAEIKSKIKRLGLSIS